MALDDLLLGLGIHVWRRNGDRDNEVTAKRAVAREVLKGVKLGGGSPPWIIYAEINDIFRKRIP